MYKHTDSSVHSHDRHTNICADIVVYIVMTDILTRTDQYTQS